jgi:hypothetical protein
MKTRGEVSQCAREPLWMRVFSTARIFTLRGIQFADMLERNHSPRGAVFNDSAPAVESRL